MGGEDGDQLVLVLGLEQVLVEARARARCAGGLLLRVLRLGRLAAEVVACNGNELQAYLHRHQSTVQNACAVGSVTALTAGMAGLGGAASAATVTVLGSHAFGAAALALGFVSAPVWPVVAGAAVGLGLGYTAWCGVRRAARVSRDH